MSIKTNIETKINTIDTGGVNTATEVREVLGTDPNSLLETIYNTVIEDSHTTETITTSNSNFEYSINVNQIGRNITISGTFIALATVGSFVDIFSFQGTDYTSGGKAYHAIAYKQFSEDLMPIRLNANSLQVVNLIVQDEEYRFTITYAKDN